MSANDQAEQAYMENSLRQLQRENERLREACRAAADAMGDIEVTHEDYYAVLAQLRAALGEEQTP